MNIKQIALVLGATVALVGGGFGAVACSSSSSGGSGSGSSSGGSGSSSGGTMDSGEDTSSGSSSGGSGSSSGSTGDAGTADCGSIPTVHMNPAGDIYCGFTGDGGSLDCVADSGSGFCCLGGKVGMGFAPQICGANAAACVADGDPDAGPSGAGIPIQCNQISDCAGNGSAGATACCLQGSPGFVPVPGCGYSKAKSGTAVVCEGSGGGAATACAAGEVNLCLADTDCPSGMHCTPGKWKIFQVGYCM